MTAMPSGEQAVETPLSPSLHFWPLPLPLGCTASDPGRVCRGEIVAVFASYQAALKFGSWDLTHTLPGEDALRDEPYYLVHTARGAMLIASRLARPGLDRPPVWSPAAIRALTGRIVNPLPPDGGGQARLGAPLSKSAAGANRRRQLEWKAKLAAKHVSPGNTEENGPVDQYELGEI